MCKNLEWRTTINDDYYKQSFTFQEVKAKYHRYPEAELMKVLHIYDLAKEPPAPNTNAHLQRAWERECRRLNPRAWAKRKAL